MSEKIAFGFRGRLAASQLALLVMLMLLLVLASILVVRGAIEHSLNERGKSRSQLIAYATAFDLSLQADLDAGGGDLALDTDDLRGLLTGLGADSQVLKAGLFTAAKAPLLAFQRVGDAWEVDPHPPIPSRWPATFEAVVDREQGFVESMTPVIGQHGTTVGWVEMRISTRAIQELEAAQVKAMIAVGAVALAATAVLSVFLGNRVTRSVNALSQAAARIASGEEQVRVEETSGRDEFAVLARTFNAAMDGLDTTTRALRGANAELAAANADLGRANAALEGVNRELEAFSYSVSHDLRAPLRGIDGFSQALLEDQEDKLDETGKDYLRRIRAGAQRMGRLIDELLELARLSRADLKRQSVDLSGIADKIVERLQAAEPERDVAVSIAPGLEVQGDTALLTVALENLLGNAWKYTGKRAEARIELSRVTVDGRPAFCVRDNGAGFDMAHAHKLFGAFQRLHAMTEFEGNGVGLATVQRIITRHGGRVWAEAEEGKGAAFFFTLDDHPPQEGA